MSRPLPSQFAQIVALMDGSTFEHERISAREKAERIASQCGWTLEAALQATNRIHPRDLPPTREEVTAAEEAVRRKEDAIRAKQEKMNAEIAPIIKIYGSLGAAFAPCWREQLLLDAVARWRVTFPAPDDRWTRTLDGNAKAVVKSPVILRALKTAYHLPTTFQEASSELHYWKAREEELAILKKIGSVRSHTRALDIVVEARVHLVRELVLHELSAHTLQDLHQRFSAIDGHKGDPTGKEWGALRNDISRLSARERDETSMQSNRNVSASVKAELRRCGDQSDRTIARIVGCSPTTVGKIRRSMR